MRTFQRAAMLLLLGAFGLALTACADFDPDKLDVFHLNEKKKLPGERKELFPEGVPGVSQGIPPEYMKGNQPPPETAQTLPADQPNPAASAEPASKKTAAVEPEPEPKPKPKPKAKRKPKPHTASQQPAAQTTSQQQPAPWPQQEQQAAPQQGQAPWPAPQGQATTAPPWPSAPAPGTFSR
jgi:hypothetical protein